MPPLLLAPATMVVSIVRVMSAVIETSWPPANWAPSWISARVRASMRMFSAIEAPTPVLPAFAVEVALVVSCSVLSATRVTLPVPAVTFAPPGTSASVCCVFTMFSASAPATPVFFEPAPEFAVAFIVLVTSGPPAVGTEVMTASMSRPFDVIVVLPTVALLVSST